MSFIYLRLPVNIYTIDRIDYSLISFIYIHTHIHYVLMEFKIFCFTIMLQHFEVIRVSCGISI